MLMRAIDIICTFALHERGSVFDIVCVMIFSDAKYRRRKKRTI